MDNWSIKHLNKSTEDRAKEYWKSESGVPIPDHVICSMPTKNSITLDHSIVNNCLVRGYSGYQNLVGTVDVTTVG